MAQSVVEKRRNIASKMVDAATQLRDALNTLIELEAEHAQIPDFQQTDFDGTDLAHLTPFLAGAVLSNLTPDVETFLTVTHSVYNDYLLQIRR